LSYLIILPHLEIFLPCSEPLLRYLSIPFSHQK